MIFEGSGEPEKTIHPSPSYSTGNLFQFKILQRIILDLLTDTKKSKYFLSATLNFAESVWFELS